MTQWMTRNEALEQVRTEVARRAEADTDLCVWGLLTPALGKDRKSVVIVVELSDGDIVTARFGHNPDSTAEDDSPKQVAMAFAGAAFTGVAMRRSPRELGPERMLRNAQRAAVHREIDEQFAELDRENARRLADLDEPLPPAVLSAVVQQRRENSLATHAKVDAFFSTVPLNSERQQ